MKSHVLAILLFSTLFYISCQAQSDTLSVAFWNLENLFDVIEDPAINDEDFLPDGEMQWTEDRLDKKMYNLARVIRMMNSGSGPDLLGVCEVENQNVLENMVAKYLSDLNYAIAYVESPDNRGIDNGLIFKADKFSLLNIQVDTVKLSDGWPTRLIFGVNLLTSENKNITVFVNHWPSRSGGQLESEPKRITAAATLRNAVDRIIANNPESEIFIIGDFNDEPLDKSIFEILKAYPSICETSTIDTLSNIHLAPKFDLSKVVFLEDGDIKFNYSEIINSDSILFNLAYDSFENSLGSFKYKDTWNMLDQIIVSRSLIIGDDLNYICNSFEVFKPSVVVTQSGQYEGTPFPTYGGRKYLGGYSDHFPVIAKFIYKQSAE